MWQGCLIDRQGGGWNLAAPQACISGMIGPVRGYANTDVIFASHKGARARKSHRVAKVVLSAEEATDTPHLPTEWHQGSGVKDQIGLERTYVKAP